MAPFGILQPVFDNDRLPSAITRTYHNPIVPGKVEEEDGGYADFEDDDDEDDEDDSDEYEDAKKIQSRIKRAQSSATPVKRAPSVAPLVNPQYGEIIPTPRQQGALARRKPVRVDMDSEDEMIWNMKNLGYKDEPVAAELVKLGKIHYDPKTIATRYSRIKKTQLAWQEQILNEDFSDFHEEEDDLLAASLAQTEILYKKDLDAIVSKRYERVASLVNAGLNRKKYTKANSKSRLIAIKNGTGVVPLERDPHPVVRTARRTREVTMGRTARDEAREAERRNRIETKERTEREAEELAQKRIEEEQERRIKREAREKKKAETAVTRETRLKIKHEEEETKAERAAMRAIQSTRKKKEIEEERAARRWDREQEKQARHAAKQQAALDKIEREAEAAKAKIHNNREEQQRRELIRRHLRGAGVLTAAPIEPAKRRNQKKAGINSGKDGDDSDDEKKPSKAELDEAEEEEQQGATWSRWTAKGRAAARKSGTKC